MKKILSALVAIAFVFGASSAVVAAGETVGDSGRIWSVPDDADRGMHIQRFLDASPGIPSSFLIDYSAWQSDAYKDPTCQSATDPNCKSESLGYSALLPACGALSQVYCIEDFGVVNSSGETTKASFSRYFPNEGLNKFSSAENLKLPFGGTGSIFDLPSAPHEGGTLYYVSALTKGDLRKNSGADLQSLNIDIYPIKLEPGDNAIQDVDPGMSKETNGGNGHPVGQWRFASFGFSGKSFCVAGSVKEKLCAQRYAFPADKKFYIKLKLQNKPKGWLHGRIYKPDVSFTEITAGYSFYIAANPVAVPVVYKMFRYPEMPQALKDQYDLKTGGYKPEVATRTPNPNGAPEGCGRSVCTDDPLTRNVIIAPSASSKFGMDQLKLWLPFVEDKAKTLLGTWSLRTLDDNENQGASECFRNGDKGVTGIVTTNATQYSAGPPSLNKSEGTLEYQVAAPHFTTKGDEFLGTYDLIMRSDVARCVYGFSSAPIRAELSVVNDQGNQKVATEILGEKNGWLYLSAGGFTYSSPTIKVKLEQDAPAPIATPTPTQTPSASAKPVAKAVTITCIKGKTSKKVTAVKPKCPTGFKKK
jgi:hypothetical protein